MLTRTLEPYLPRSVKRRLSRVWAIPVKLKIAFEARGAHVNPKPIFVLGNQRSGTTAIAILLAERTGLSVTSDLFKERKTKSPTYDRVQKGNMLFAKFVGINKLDFSRDIVKEPHLTVLYQQLVQHFPQFKCVFVLRDPRDNIRSILNRLSIPGDLIQLERQHRKEITPAWELVMDGHWLGLKGETYIDMLAARWNFMADVYLHNQQRMVLTRYEAFLQDKVGEITRLTRHLALDPLHDISDKVDMQFQRAGNKDVKWQEFFGDENLARIERICGARMRLLNYLPSAERTDPA